MALKRKKPNYASRYRGAVVVIILAVVVIVALDIFSILVAACPELIQRWFSLDTPPEALPLGDSLLATSLSIIGIAISVWATLNIINVLDKNDVAELKNQLATLKEENETYIAKQHYNMLLGQFEQCSSDSAMAYIARKFQDMSDLPYAQLSIVMQFYIRVFDLHKQDNDGTLLNNAADEGIRYAKEILEQDNHLLTKNIRLFLHYCIGEFYFYKSYTSKDEKSFAAAINAATQYEIAIPLFDVHLPQCTAQKMQNYPNMDFGDLPNASELTTYMCNTYGECYSKALQAYNANPSMETKGCNIDTIRKKAIYYCEYAVSLSKRNNQTYLRNLGCALEAAYKLDTAEGTVVNKITAAYQDAINVCIKAKHIPQKVFYTWLSFYHKYINQKIKVLRKGQTEKEWLARIGIPWEEKISEYFKNALAYSELAYKTYPDNLVFLKFHAFVLRDMCIWETKCSGKSELACAYFEKFTQVLQTLQVLYVNNYDPFMTELTNWHEYLSEVNLKKTYENDNSKNNKRKGRRQ